MTKTIQKTVSCILVLALCACMSAAAFADNYDESGADASVNISFEWKNDPTYTVTIPSSVTMANDGAVVDFTVEDMQNMEGKKVVVTIAGTDQFRDQMLLSSTDSNHSIRYQLIKADGTVLETTGSNINGGEVAAFAQDGTQQLTFKPVLSQTSSAQPGHIYAGRINFKVAVQAV